MAAARRCPLLVAALGKEFAAELLHWQRLLPTSGSRGRRERIAVEIASGIDVLCCFSIRSLTRAPPSSIPSSQAVSSSRRKSRKAHFTAPSSAPRDYVVCALFELKAKYHVRSMPVPRTTRFRWCVVRTRVARAR